jgi:hypothetical protein
MSRMKILTYGTQYYRTACKFLSLDPDVYDSGLVNLMERIVQYVKDRTEDFDIKEFLEKTVLAIEVVKNA